MGLQSSNKVLNEAWLGKHMALLVVDVQNDFLDGSLAVGNGSAKSDYRPMLWSINKLLSNDRIFKKVLFSQDWHPSDHMSFHSNRKLYSEHLFRAKDRRNDEEAELFEVVEFRFPGLSISRQVLWPDHCLQNSFGAMLHNDLNFKEEYSLIHKGTHSLIESYSVFGTRDGSYETKLLDILKSSNIEVVVVCGVALEYCVMETALDSVWNGFLTVVIDDACCGINIGSEGVLDRFDDEGVIHTNTDTFLRLALK